MKEIKLTKGQCAKVADEWYDYLMQWNWGAWWNKDTKSYYARRGDKHSKTILMHRVVANTPVGMICDHKNHNTLDNQPENLRNVTHAQSNMNTKPRKSILKEPNIRPMGKGFEVRFNLNGKPTFCQTFSTIEEAIEIRNSFIQKFHNEFAYTGES